MKKPEKISLIKFWLGPLSKFWYELLEGLGWWDCQYCEKLHSPRTKKYYELKKMGVIIVVCSLWKEENDEN